MAELQELKGPGSSFNYVAEMYSPIYRCANCQAIVAADGMSGPSLQLSLLRAGKSERAVKRPCAPWSMWSCPWCDARAGYPWSVERPNVLEFESSNWQKLA
jgi:hypothetical protein